uniref:hypothetical protein n=1 Tax=uncultured Erythrobacter sp. TaxID=263913 RepID=UPI0026230EC6|nr:hypothetical protein [uncultured Erythrobacter sp.]
MRHAADCASVDPRTDLSAFERENARTNAMLDMGRVNGVGHDIEAAERHWVETDGYGDMACEFQLVDDISETQPSLDKYRAANNALKAAIAAEAN